MASPLSNSLLVSSLVNIKAEDCRELTEQFFRQKDFEFAKTTILVARRKNPNLPSLNLYLSAYLVHEIAFKTKNWYRILLIRDNSVGMNEMKKQYENLVWRGWFTQRDVLQSRRRVRWSLWMQHGKFCLIQEEGRPTTWLWKVLIIRGSRNWGFDRHGCWQNCQD